MQTQQDASRYAETMNSAPQVFSPVPHVDPSSNDAPEVAYSNAPEVFVKGDDAVEIGPGSPAKENAPHTDDAPLPWHKRRRFWLIIAAALICAIIAAVVGGVVGSQDNKGGEGGDGAEEQDGSGSSTTPSSPTSLAQDSPSSMNPSSSSPSSTHSGSPSATTPSTSPSPSASDVLAVIIPWSDENCQGSKPVGDMQISDQECFSLHGESIMIDYFADDCVIYEFDTDDCGAQGEGRWARHVTPKACFANKELESFNITCY